MEIVYLKPKDEKSKRVIKSRDFHDRRKPGKDKNIISPSAQIIEIEHKLGEDIFIQKLTIPRKRAFTDVYQFKCTLLDTNPPVWRRIQVPENYTFYDLHVAIQDVMDWKDYHLHCFIIPGIGTFEEIAHIECPWWDPWDMDEDWLITTETPLKDFFRNPKDRVVYRYDYGDSWQMNIILEKVLPKEKSIKHPVCVGGELAAPLEDSGGIPGYYRCIEAFEKAIKLDLEDLPEKEVSEELWDLILWMGERFIIALDLE